MARPMIRHSSVWWGLRAWAARPISPDECRFRWVWAAECGCCPNGRGQFGVRQPSRPLPPSISCRANCVELKAAAHRDPRRPAARDSYRAAALLTVPSGQLKLTGRVALLTLLDDREAERLGL